MTARKPRPSGPAQNLTLQQKRLVIDEHIRRENVGESRGQGVMAEWARTAFELTCSPSQSTISRLLKDRTKIMKATTSGTLMKQRVRRGACPEVDEAMFKWATNQYSKGVVVTGELLKAYGRRLIANLNKSLPEGQQILLKMSSGWLEGFQKRYNLSSFHSHGPSGGADVAAIAREMPVIRSKLSKFKVNDIYNADEFGLYYCMAPDRTIALKQLEGYSKQKVRITCLPCCNASGTDKFEMMIVGKAFRPRAFQNKSGRELGFDYHNNAKAWMTSCFFHEWLLRFDRHIAKTPGRKVLLLLDSCSAHGSYNSLPLLKCTEILFLPANTSSALQPMGAGIIGAVKKRYRRNQLLRALDMADCEASDMYKVDQLQAMRWITTAWQEISVDTVKHCWGRTGILQNHPETSKTTSEAETVSAGVMPSTSSNEAVGTDPAVVAEISSAMLQLVPSHALMSVDFLVNPPEEDDCLETVTDADIEKALHASVLKAAKGRGNPPDEESLGIAGGSRDTGTANAPLRKESFTPAEKANVLARACVLASDSPHCTPDVLHCLRQMKADAKLEVSALRK